MRRATIVGIVICLSPVIYAAGCASQEDGVLPPSLEEPRAGSSNSGGSTSGGNGGNTSGGSTSGGSTSGGTGGNTSGGAPEAGAGGTPEGGAAGSGWVYDGTCANQNHAQCDDDNPCTDDACNVTTCQHVNNTDPCDDDGDDCTADQCSGGICTHPDNGTCECEEDIDCDDENPCTDDDCLPDLSCQYTDNTDPCASDDNSCTDDVCEGGECKHNPNDDPCPDDGSDCTDDVCAAGACTHPNNMTCECTVDADCDALAPDPPECTFNRCSVQGDCAFIDNDSCDVGTPFTINNFNSSANWTAGVTTPDGRPLVHDFEFHNLEGNAVLYLAVDTGDNATLTMDVASMAGLTNISVDILASQTNTAQYVDVGVFDGTSWVDLPFPGTIGTSYSVTNIPLLSFGVPLAAITKVRFRFESPGSLRYWRINEILATD